MEIVDQIDLRPAPAPVTTRGLRAAPARSGAASLELDLNAEENAVVLVEQDGLYSWHFPTTETAAPKVARGRGLAVGKTARFTIALNPTAPTGPPRRGLVQDFLLSKARAVVLKFAARFAVGAAMQGLERNVRRAFILMDGADPQHWHEAQNLTALKLPENRPARLLLFVHGTFSSTVGSFGGLGATPWGREFLTAASAKYDAVIGFDHATLSEDPLTNAKDLLQRLQLSTMAHPPRIDAISYSRGGLVLRSLQEDLLPAQPARPEMRRAIFVGVVNGGTLLARPENWRTLIDLYTNLAAAACRVLALFPQMTFGAVLTREIVQGVGAFAKYLATEAVTRAVFPASPRWIPRAISSES